MAKSLEQEGIPQESWATAETWGPSKTTHTPIDVLVGTETTPEAVIQEATSRNKHWRFVSALSIANGLVGITDAVFLFHHLPSYPRTAEAVAHGLTISSLLGVGTGISAAFLVAGCWILKESFQKPPLCAPLPK